MPTSRAPACAGRAPSAPHCPTPSRRTTSRARPFPRCLRASETTTCPATTFSSSATRRRRRRSSFMAAASSPPRQSRSPSSLQARSCRLGRFYPIPQQQHPQQQHALQATTTTSTTTPAACFSSSSSSSSSSRRAPRCTPHASPPSSASASAPSTPSGTGADVRRAATGRGRPTWVALPVLRLLWHADACC